MAPRGIMPCAGGLEPPRSLMTDPNNRNEIRITRLCLSVTLGVLAEVIYFLAAQGKHAFLDHHPRTLVEVIVFGAAVLFLIYGNVLYQCCRLGYYQRRRKHKPALREALNQLNDGEAPSLAILIPSYKEETPVIWQTMVSAALTEYPEKSVTLLIDDPYRPQSTEDVLKLEEARNMPAILQKMFDSPASHYSEELLAFRRRAGVDSKAEVERLAQCYVEVSEWFQALGAQFLSERNSSFLSHTDRFFLEEIIQEPARRHAAFAEELRERMRRNDIPDDAYCERQYIRLAGLFNVRFSSFERKKYRNLSHESNKAMNLNSYIGLIGKAWREVECGNGWQLREALANAANFEIPDARYLITLDADSLILSDYALRLIQIMEQPENQNLAVIQTPYSAFPDSQNLLERIAGATTDLQYIIHQGFTQWNGTFWVGANALIRRRALEDIKHTRLENGFRTAVYIQDRTVIEDTESTIDLIGKGWQLHNYPERLAYSATPPDFGALLIQRRRWANGGLLIAPKLLRYAAKRPKNWGLCKELFVRFHYLASLAGVSAATLLVFLYPFKDSLATIWVPLSALPYFILYARDLKIAGYRCSDVFRVYALNLILIPVVLGGVLKSLHQGVTDKKIPFGRTPKISGKTAAPALYCFLELVLPMIFLAAFGWDMSAHRWSHALFSLFNGAFFAYALVRMVDMRDMASGLVRPREVMEAWLRGPWRSSR